MAPSALSSSSTYKASVFSEINPIPPYRFSLPMERPVTAYEIRGKPWISFWATLGAILNTVHI